MTATLRGWIAAWTVGIALYAAVQPVAWSAEPAADSTEAVSARIDAVFEQAWQDAGVRPAPIADDAMFLRRVFLDLTGVIPTVSEARAFLADERPDKRTRLIDALLQRPRHATQLANAWRRVLLPRGANEFAAGRMQDWLERQFRAEKPYDALVREVLTARGTAAQSPPVVYYDALELKPEELAASASQVFLGVQIRCAQCHDHPFASWKQDDFWGLAAYFARLSQSANVSSTGLADLPSGEVTNPKSQAVAAPRFPGGSGMAESDARTRREQLADWVVAPDNPYFARATVNRLWGLMFGRGLVEPVDDLGEHNPAGQSAALELLAADFTIHGYNIQRVLRILAGTRLYQQTSDPVPDQTADPALFVGMPVRSLSAEQAYDCLVTAAGLRDSLDPNDPRRMAARQAFLTQFEAPTRQPTEFQAGIPQALTMLNGPLVEELADPDRGDLIAATADSPFLNDDQRIETLFLAALARPPRAEERARMAEHLAARGDSGRREALSDLLWALLNSSEFIVNR